MNFRFALRRLISYGVEFIANPPGVGGNQTHLDEASILRLLEIGPDDFWCERYGITSEKLSKWVSFCEGTGQCQGMKRNGKPCGNQAQTNPYGISPREFRPGIDDRCSHHIERGSKGKP